MKKTSFHISLAVFVIVILIAGGTAFYKFHENLSYVDAFYFTTTTVTTIGFGDFHPTTDTSKLFASIYALISVPTLIFCLGLVVKDYFENKLTKIESDINKRLGRE
ncbi:MAG: potassium channel family protein [Patescibacteria group bacterium]